jgi:hypothetical protein
LTTPSTQNPTPVTDRSLWYTDLSSLDPALKNEVWAAQSLMYMKRVAVRFLDPEKARKYRKIDRLEVDQQVYKEMVDPKTPLGGGGTAEHFSSDFKANPIYIHLKNIVKAEMQKTGKQLEVRLTDKYAKTRRMNENYRILYRGMFRNLINHFAKEIGIPGVSESQDPYKWAENFMSGGQGKQMNDVVDKYIDLIRNQITDSQDIALYNELIYKGDYEMAFELGMDYYINTLNKWDERWADEFIDDIMLFNKACGEWTTDLITGRPLIERFVPESLWVSPFSRKDGEDIEYYFIEYSISFGEFTKVIGRDLSPAELQEVFMINKSQGSCHNIEWIPETFAIGRTNLTRDNAMIRVGRAAFLSQDISVQLEDTNTGFTYIPTDIRWAPLPHERRIEKHFNVWRSWYYIPPTGSQTNNADYVWQSRYIFQLKKNEDQYRFGTDGIFSKSPLVIYDNSSQATYQDIVEAFMPKINHAWHKFQNCLVNDFDAVIFSDDFIGGLTGAVEEQNNVRVVGSQTPTGGTGKDAYLQQWKMIIQSGKGFLKMRDNNGQMILEPDKLMVHIKNDYLEKAEKYLMTIVMQYDLLVKALALSPMSAGEEVKPRTPVAAIEQNLKAQDSATFFVQKGYETFKKMYGERAIQHILLICRDAKDGYTKRYQEFMDNVGYANGLAIEGIADTDPNYVALKVDYVDNTAKKEFIMQLAVEYVKTKDLSEDFLYLIMGCENWKYAYVLMRLAIKQRKKEMQEEQARQQQYIMEQKQMDLNIMIAAQGAKDAGKDQNIVTQGRVDDMVQQSLNKAKYETQARLAMQKDQQRQSENNQKTELDKNKETHKKNLEMQMPPGVTAA